MKAAADGDISVKFRQAGRGVRSGISCFAVCRPGVRKIGSRLAARGQGVPSMGRILLDERSQSGAMTPTVAEPQGVAVR